MERTPESERGDKRKGAKVRVTSVGLSEHRRRSQSRAMIHPGETRRLAGQRGINDVRSALSSPFFERIQVSNKGQSNYHPPL